MVKVTLLPVSKLVGLVVNDGIGSGVNKTINPVLVTESTDPLAPKAALPEYVPLVFQAVNETVNVPPSTSLYVLVGLRDEEVVLSPKSQR